MSFDQIWLRKFLVHLTNERNLAANTVKNYSGDIEELGRYCKSIHLPSWEDFEASPSKRISCQMSVQRFVRKVSTKETVRYSILL